MTKSLGMPIAKLEILIFFYFSRIKNKIKPSKSKSNHTKIIFLVITSYFPGMDRYQHLVYQSFRFFFLSTCPQGSRQNSLLSHFKRKKHDFFPTTIPSMVNSTDFTYRLLIFKLKFVCLTLKMLYLTRSILWSRQVKQSIVAKNGI